MLVLGPIGFAAPLLLLGLLALPVLWFLLRAVPPAPVRRRFPGIILLLGLKDDEHETDKTPWWLLLLRVAAVAALIVGFAGPVLNPKTDQPGDGPLLVLLDGTWADARDWPGRVMRISALLDEAARAARPVALVALTDPPPGGPAFQAADRAMARLPALTPQPWEPDAAALADWAGTLPIIGFETFWMSDGLDRDSRAPLLDALQARGPVTVFEGGRPVLALRPAAFDDGEIRLTALRDRTGSDLEATLTAHGLDPRGVERELARAGFAFAADEAEAGTALVLPVELRNRISRFQIEGLRSAGAVSLTDDALKRRKVALVAGRDDREGLQLLSPLHYLRQALDPVSDLIEGGGLADMLLAAPNVVVLADVAQLTATEREALVDWLDRGGILLRFAGPRLAASEVARDSDDPLLPVRLRAGGRTVGGAMSWGEPKALRPFAESSPFHGLPLPGDVSVSAQVMAQPDPDLAERTIAALDDGTPLVTRSRVGQGQVVLFHVTANAEWSSLPLSGLFVQMLERLAVSSRAAAPEAGDLAGTVWTPKQRIDAFGTVSDAGDLPGVPGAALAEALGGAGPDAALPPGLYATMDRQIALNVIGPQGTLAATVWPASVVVEGLTVTRETLLKGWLLSVALLLLMIDILAALALGGRFGRRAGAVRGSAAGPVALAVAAVLGMALAGAGGAWAQTGTPDRPGTPDEEAFALQATTEVLLAHVLTGDPEVDRIAEAGLRGLSIRLRQRTSVEPAEPMAVNLETDDLAFFPFLYWPVSTRQPLPSSEAYARLNDYLRTGGMILFDTRDADVAGFGGATPQGRKLQQLAAPLDIPALEPVPDDHVLTRTFYLLADFPGRHTGRSIWVEAAPPDAERAEGMPFRNLNDGVTPVVIGGNDWASAWALDPRGAAMFPIGRGYSGDRQREVAFRFGINLLMHVLTGNYKSDQVHVPALLDRLGQ